LRPPPARRRFVFNAHLLEQLTDANLRASFHSHTCPGCAVWKLKKRTFCGSCWNNLPEYLQGPLLADQLREGYDLAVLGAMRHLGRQRFITPPVPKELGYDNAPAKFEAVSAELCARIVAGNVCPKCAGDKFSGAVFCRPCDSRLGEYMATVSRRGPTHDATLFGSNLAAVREDLEVGKLLHGTPDQVVRFRKALCQAVKVMKEKSLHFRRTPE